jgi:leucyl aminopeptidase
MQIHFTSSPPSDLRLRARVINQGAALTGLDAALIEGAAASRFTGRAGQVFEGFASVDGAVRRIAVAGAGELGGAERRLDLERAGAALTAKYLVSTEQAMVLDLGQAGLGADGAAGPALARLAA